MADPKFNKGDSVFWIENDKFCEGIIESIISTGSSKSEPQYKIKVLSGSQTGSIRKMSEKRFRDSTFEKIFGL